jgi:hypothetical protein
MSMNFRRVFTREPINLYFKIALQENQEIMFAQVNKIHTGSVNHDHTHVGLPLVRAYEIVNRGSKEKVLANAFGTDLGKHGRIYDFFNIQHMESVMFDFLVFNCVLRAWPHIVR